MGVRRSNEPRGFSLLLVLAGLCLVTALFVGAMGAERPLSAARLLVLAVALPAGVAATSAAARRAPHDALMFLVVAGFVGGLILGAVAIFGVQPHPVAAGAATGCAIAFVGSAARLLFLQRVRDPFPDVLAERFGAGAALEMDEVQFVVEAPSAAASASRPAELRVWLQNTMDARREVEVRLDVATQGLLLAPHRSHASLEPLEAGTLTIPVAARPAASGRVTANVWLTAAGAGRRRRLRRATAAARPTAPWLKLLEILALAHNPLHLLSVLRGERAYGVKLELDAAAAPGVPSARHGEARWVSVWRESPLTRAAREAGLGA